MATRKLGISLDDYLPSEEKEIEKRLDDAHEVHEDGTRSTRSQSKKAQEVQEVQEELKPTQGVKGSKRKRINMAFSDANYDYIVHESRRRGISATQFVNNIIAAYRAES